jgi:hypothetical protein
VQCPSHLVVRDLSLLKMCERYKFRSSSLCNFLSPPISSYLLGQNIPLRIQSSTNLHLCSFFQDGRRSFTPTQNYR